MGVKCSWQFLNDLPTGAKDILDSTILAVLQSRSELLEKELFRANSSLRGVKRTSRSLRSRWIRQTNRNKTRVIIGTFGIELHPR